MTPRGCDLPVHMDLPEDSRDERARLVAFCGGEAAYAALIVARHRSDRDTGPAELADGELGDLAQAIRELTKTLRLHERTEGSLDAAEAVKYLRLPSHKALYQLVRRGVLPVHRLGRRLRFVPSELDAALRAKGAVNCGSGMEDRPRAPQPRSRA